MDVLLTSATHGVLALGSGLVAGAGQEVVRVSSATYSAILTALQSVTGDGYVTLGADLVTVGSVAASAGWTTSQTAAAARRTLVAQHKTALAHLYAGATANSAQIAGDLTALQTIAGALQAGTVPTAAQQVIIDRVYLRLFIVLMS